MALFPRLHLFEIEDQPWCPQWLRAYLQSLLARLWQLQVPRLTVCTPADAATSLILNNIPNPSSFTFVDLCAGAGGPIPIIEPRLNSILEERGEPPAQFVLTDLYPCLDRWREIAKRHESITFMEKSLDARECRRVAVPPKKECRVFNACFHHFDDETAVGVLGSAIGEADAFFIQEGFTRNITSLINAFFESLFLPLYFTLETPRYRRSPLHLFFTFIIPVIPLMVTWDGVVSALRGRTPRELQTLVQRTGLDLTGWEFRSGEVQTIRPLIWTYWFVGVKKGSDSIPLA